MKRLCVILMLTTFVCAQSLDSLVHLHVSTWPTGALVSKDLPPDNHNSQVETEPTILTITRSENPVALYFFKPGFHDTLIHVKLRNTPDNFIFLHLQAEHDSLALAEQSAFLDQRDNRSYGRVLLWGSALPALVAGVLWYQASESYRKANAARSQAEQSILTTTPHYASLQQTFNAQEKSGNTSRTQAYIAAGLAVLVLTAGITLYF